MFFFASRRRHTRCALVTGVQTCALPISSQHDAKWLAQFAERMTRIPEVVELYRMSGEIDYMMRVVVPDIKAYDDVYKRLHAAVPPFDVSSSYALAKRELPKAQPVDYHIMSFGPVGVPNKALARLKGAGQQTD